MMQVYIVLGTWRNSSYGERTSIVPRRAFLSYEEAQEAAKIAEKAVTDDASVTGTTVDFSIETIHAY